MIVDMTVILTSSQVLDANHLCLNMFCILMPYGGRVVEVGVFPMVGKGSIPLLGKIPRHTYPAPHDVAGSLVCQTGTVYTWSA